jgi:hypothetical protein
MMYWKDSHKCFHVTVIRKQVALTRIGRRPLLSTIG